MTLSEQQNNVYELVPEQKGGWPCETSVLPPLDPPSALPPANHLP